MKALITLIGRIGLDTRDSDETALRKRLAVVLCAGTLPLTLLWSAIYLAVGAPIAAAIPGFYTAFTPINTAIFAHTRNFRFYRFTPATPHSPPAVARDTEPWWVQAVERRDYLGSAVPAWLTFT